MSIGKKSNGSAWRWARPTRLDGSASVSGMIVGLPGTGVNEKGECTSRDWRVPYILTTLAGIQLDCYASGVSLLERTGCAQRSEAAGLGEP